LYMNILSSFRGYNDDEFKDAGKGFIDDLSSHCLDYAKERGILPSSDVANSQQQGLKFRFATEMDETMLVALSEKVRFMIDIIIAVVFVLSISIIGFTQLDMFCCPLILSSLFLFLSVNGNHTQSMI